MNCDVAIIGSGMGSLSAAALLAKEGKRVIVLEQNWQPGGCTSSYWRKGFVFESGATTLVGLDKNMPLRYLLDKTGIQINTRKLELPMQIHLNNGLKLNRFQDLECWIAEISRHFDGDQRKFWTLCFEVSQFVWKASTKYLHFPPSNLRDVMKLASNAAINDVAFARFALVNTERILEKYHLNDLVFRQFIDEQLLITAQNRANEVNFLFGAAALCYTNYGNYYVDGGLLNLVNPIVNFVKENNGDVLYREPVVSVKKNKGGYSLETKSKTIAAKYIISGIPVDQTLALVKSKKNQNAILPSEKLYSAFQMGIGFKSDQSFESLHHQVHVPSSLPGCGAKSFFVSLSHPEDKSRSDVSGAFVASVSAHIPDPEKTLFDAKVVEEAILKVLVEKNFLRREDIIYMHSSTQKSWKKWTNRSHGSVGGYPQFMKTKPWQMIESRIEKGVYQCGDTSYPGQGIPGATLSGIIAAEKLKSDWR